MSFKQFFKESTELAYDHPPERAKFQLGDLVVIRDDGRWRTYQSKKTASYINHIGEVVGYKNVPGSYTKFALKFSDNTVVLVHSHFLYGPFKDAKIAQKYTDPKVTINPADIKLKQGAGTLTDYQKRDNVETFLKDFLPKIGYTLLPQPKEVISQDGKYVHTVFATMDIEYCEETARYGLTVTTPGKFSCYRVNSARTKKLKSVFGGSLNSIVDRRVAHSTSAGLSYFIECPEKNNDFDIDINNLFTLTQLGIPSNPKLLDIDNIIKAFNSYKNTVQQIKASKFNTDLDIVKLFYDVSGDTITSEEVIYNKVNLKDKNFYKPFKIKGNFAIEISKNTDLTSIPKEITGNLTIRSWYRANDDKSLKNLNGIQVVGGNINVSHINLKSLLGSPKIVNGDFECSQNDLVNFKGGPEDVRGNFDFSYNKKLTSLNGLPKAKTYDYSDALLNGREVTEKDIEIALLKDKLTPATKETFGTLMDEL